MSKIHLPPTSLIDSVIPVCVFIGDILEIDIDHSGLCVHTPDGLFNPDLPSGKVAKTTLTLSPTKDGTAYLAYSDTENPGLFLFVITIQEDPCP